MVGGGHGPSHVVGGGHGPSHVVGGGHGPSHGVTQQSPAGISFRRHGLPVLTTLVSRSDPSSIAI